MQVDIVGGTTLSEQPSEQPASPTPSAETGQVRQSTMFTFAVYSAAVGMILLIVSFVLDVYYNERAMSQDSLRGMYDLAKAVLYCGTFGWIATILAVALVIKGFIAIGSKASMSLLRSVDLRTALMMTVIAFVLLVVAAAAVVTMIELQEHLDDTVYDIVTRMYVYFGSLATAVEGALVLIVVDGLRRAQNGLSVSQ